MNRALPLRPLFDAHAALRAIVNTPSGTIPWHLWNAASLAASRLECALADAGVTVAVEEEAKEEAHG